jgi:transcriptional regulator with XRE-family HTH domain
MGRLKTPPEVDKQSQAVVQLLKVRREDLRWSQPMLAARLGISVETIRAIEQGKHPNLAFFTVARWARAVGASLEELEALSAGESESVDEE